MQNLLHDLKILLQRDERLVSGGKLLKNTINELALQNDAILINILLSHPPICKYFFQQVGKVVIFDKSKFQQIINSNEFLADNYTSISNKIGLTSASEFIGEGKEVVLSFPFKDCVLESNQSGPEKKRKEIFKNEILAPDETECLLEEKALVGFKRITEKGEEFPDQISIDDNLLIKGNNLQALHSLKKAFQARNKFIKLIYIDPPYNTGNGDFGYNDSYSHSTWLTFMKNRLEVAWELLTIDGSIWIHIDDREAHYLKVLCDELFGRENFVANIIWQKKFSPQNDAKYFSDNHDHILVYAKNKSNWKPNLLARSEKTLARYANPDNDPRGNWASGGLDVKTYSAACDYPITTPSGRVINPPKGSCWRVSKQRFEELVSDNRIWFGTEGNNIPRLKRFLTDVKKGQTPLTIWLHTEAGHNQEAKQELNKLLESDLFKTPKPERLLKQIIEIGSNTGDLVLDFFSGSGTTAAVSLKLNRKFIAIEQMDYIETITKMRLKKVVSGEQGGVSKSLSWNGGGEFIYFQLANCNDLFFKAIAQSKNKKSLAELLLSIERKGFVTYKRLIKLFNKGDFKLLSVEEQQKILLEMLNKNTLYIPFSEIEDNDYSIDERTKLLNYSFYSTNR